MYTAEGIILSKYTAEAMLLSNNSFCTSSKDARRRWDALRCYSLELVGVVQTYQLWSKFDRLASVRGSLQGLLTQEAWLRFILVNSNLLKSNLLKSISINSANSSLNNQFLDLYSRMTDGFPTGLMFPADEDRETRAIVTKFTRQIQGFWNPRT